MTQVIACPPDLDHRAHAAPSLTPLKERQRAMWASGDFAVIGTTLQIVGETLCEAVDLRAGSSVLDAACGNGNATLAAARRFCNVTGLDYVPALLQRAAERAAAERLDVRLLEGDVEQLPFSDCSFDCVLSTFGVMFAPDHVQTASELRRVCKPGGKIGVANWTKEGFIGRLLGVVSRHVPPAPGGQPGILWGSEAHIGQLFGAHAASITTVRKTFAFRYTSPEHFIQVFRDYYGPTHKAFAALEPAGQAALQAELAALLAEFNQAPGQSLVIHAEYLEAIIVTK